VELVELLLEQLGQDFRALGEQRAYFTGEDAVLEKLKRPSLGRSSV
jgi:hypothetical protein